MNRPNTIFIIIASLLLLPMFAQQRDSTVVMPVLKEPVAEEPVEEDRDSLVRLLSAKSAQIVEINGISYRKVFGPAVFEHNNTVLLCDTALWNVSTNIIDAIGNVSIIQEQTELTSDKMVYYVSEDLAQFRGNLVQLKDQDNNLLRTQHLDYNTKDSIAIFRNGGAMKDKDGQIIESTSGRYESKAKTFLFTDNVNMFTDSVFVNTTTLLYEADYSKATFGRETNVWKDDNMLSSQAGWYDRANELFLFHKNVHILTDTQEGWCDSLYYHRYDMILKMLGNAQVKDTTRNVYSMAGEIHYVDSLSKINMTRDPAVVILAEDESKQVDTIYFGADTLIYHTERMCDIEESVVADAAKRRETINSDPVSNYRKAATEAARKAAEAAAKNDPNNPDNYKKGGKLNTAQPLPDKPVSQALPDKPVSQETIAPVDTTSVANDSTVLEPTIDTTDIGFLIALRNVKIFKDDIQVKCDSLVYSDLDSLARLFKEPVIWDEITRQYTADSVSLAVKNGNIDRASLMSNAFVHIEQDSLHHNQIRGTEMMAYFEGQKGLRRFDALGGAAALFYIEENGTLATVNKKESKMLSAEFTDGNISKIYYFEAPKSDAYPVVQLQKADMELKGYNWNPEIRPKSKADVTSYELKKGERSYFEAIPRADYIQAEVYFPGYMNDVYRQIEIRDSMAVVREKERKRQEEFEKKMAKLRTDSLFVADSLARVDSLFRVDSLKTVTDSLKKIKADSLKIVSDSLALVKAKQDSIAPPKLSWKERRAIAREERKLKREKKLAQREEKWAKMDERDEQRRQEKIAKR